MNVLHVIPSVSVAHGGPSRAVVEMERALADRGVNVTTVTTDDDGKGRRLSMVREEAIETEFATRWYFPLNTEFYKVSLSLARWLQKNIKKFDVVHAHALFSFAPIAAAYIARGQSVPYILRPLGVLGRYGLSGRRPYLKRVSLNLIERPLIESAAVVHFTSVAEKAEVEALGLTCNGVVIPLGVDTGNVDHFKKRTSLKSDSVIELLFLSRIDPKKNLENLLRALSLVLMTRRNLRLSIAGSGDPAYIDTLQALAQHLQVADRVKWLGFVDGDQKLEVLGSATAFVLPSYSENFGVSVVEALSSGLPCIVSRYIAISMEIEIANAGVVTDTEPASIAKGILRVVDNNNEYFAMSVAAQKLARARFSREVMGRSLDELYRKIKMSSIEGDQGCCGEGDG
jgi:glycosyltransferase involved in cell wall biosynthesis